MVSMYSLIQLQSVLSYLIDGAYLALEYMALSSLATAFTMHVIVGCVQGVTCPKLLEKIHHNVINDHSGFPEHYIIGLHTMKHTPTHTLKHTNIDTDSL